MTRDVRPLSDDLYTEATTNAQLTRRLGSVARRAVERAEDCLADIAARSEEENRDRGARSAESLMRVAKTAVGLREQLERFEREDDGAKATDAQHTISREDTEKLLYGFEEEIDRIAARIGRDHVCAGDPLSAGDDQ